jgi:hypothetical protein
MRKYRYIYIHARAPTPPHTRQLSSDNMPLPWILPPNLANLARVHTRIHAHAIHACHTPVLATTRTQASAGCDHARTHGHGDSQARTLGVRQHGDSPAARVRRWSTCGLVIHAPLCACAHEPAHVALSRMRRLLPARRANRTHVPLVWGVRIGENALVTGSFRRLGLTELTRRPIVVIGESDRPTARKVVQC